MLTISVIAQKGGSGKTTLARSLAVACELDGKSAAVVDLDPQASAALWSKRRGEEPPEVISTVLPLLGDILKQAAEMVDVVILDTPPKSSEAAIAAAQAADLIIIPCRPQVDDIETLPGTKQILAVAGSAPTFVVLNAVSPIQARNEEAASAIAEHPTAPFDVCPQTLGNRAAFGDASVLGQTPQEYDPRGKAALEIQNVYKYAMEQVSQ